MTTVTDEPQSLAPFPGLIIPDTVRELLDLAGDSPHELLIKVYSRKLFRKSLRLLGTGEAPFDGKPFKGRVTRHHFTIPIHGVGIASLFTVFLDDFFVGQGTWAPSPPVVPGDTMNARITINWE